MNVGEPEQSEVGENLAAETAGAWERVLTVVSTVMLALDTRPALLLTDDEDFALLAEEALRLVAALERDLVGPGTAAGEDAVYVVIPCDHLVALGVSAGERDEAKRFVAPLSALSTRRQLAISGHSAC